MRDPALCPSATERHTNVTGTPTGFWPIVVTLGYMFKKVSLLVLLTGLPEISSFLLRNIFWRKKSDIGTKRT